MANGRQESRKGRHHKHPAGSKNKALSSIYFFLLIISSSVLLVFFVFYQDQSLDSLLREIDQAQQGNGQAATQQLYKRATRKASSETDYLRIVKRVYQISVQNSELYLAEVTRRGVKELPESEELWAHHVSALLDQGKILAAIAAAEQLKSDKFLPLRGEIMLQSMLGQQGNGQKNQGYRESEDLSIAQIAEKIPDSAAIYLALAKLFHTPRFAWNAALLYMVGGEKGKALAIVRELKGEDWLNTLGAALIAYDNESWELAAELLEKERQSGRVSIQALHYLGNVYAYLRNFEKVIEILSLASDLATSSLQHIRTRNAEITLDTEDFTPGDSLKEASENLGSWQLYYNLASAYREQENNKLAFEVLRQARSIFPYDNELLLLLNVIAPVDEKEYAKSILSEFITKDTINQPNLALASLIFADERINLKRFSTRLWELFSRFPEYDPILRYLLWYYIGLSRTDEVELALERYNNLVLRKSQVPQEFPDWMKEYMALSDVLKQDFTRAKNTFTSLIAVNPSWRNYYNLANIYVYEADFSSAIRVLRQAKDSTNKEEERVEVYYRMVVISQITDQSVFSADEMNELEQILRKYVAANYRGTQQQVKLVGDVAYFVKLDTLLLWQKSIGNTLLADPAEFRKEVRSFENPEVGANSARRIVTGGNFVDLAQQADL